MVQSQPRVPIGARRRRFVLERPLEEPDGFGGVVRRYVAGPLLWGAIEPLGHVERVRLGRAEAIATHRVRFAYGPAITPTMRLASGPRRFAIRTAGDPDGRRRELICQVAESVRVAVNGIVVAAPRVTCDATTGRLTFAADAVPAADARVTAGFTFDVPVRFDTDDLSIDLSAFSAGEIPKVPLIEIVP